MLEHSLAVVATPSPSTPHQPTHTAPPPAWPQVFDLKSGEKSKRVTVKGAASKAKVIAADINAGCPAVIHVINNVLLPKGANETSSSTSTGAAASGMQGMFKLFGH